MDNPYAAPHAALENDALVMRKKTGWKIMFWCYLIVEVMSVIGMFFSEDDTVFDIVGDIVVYSFVLAGIFAFAYNKKIAVSALWKLVLLVLFVWDCYVFSSLFKDDTFADINTFVTIGLCGVVAIIAFFEYFALYQYAFQSKEIWSKP